MTGFGNSLFVVGIDIGSEYSGYAYAFRYDIRHDPHLIRAHEWNESNRCSLKCPTTILINSNEEMVAFGFEAERMFSELLENNKHHDYYYFKNFRNDLYQVFKFFYQPIIMCFVREKQITGSLQCHSII